MFGDRRRWRLEKLRIAPCATVICLRLTASRKFAAAKRQLYVFSGATAFVVVNGDTVPPASRLERLARNTEVGLPLLASGIERFIIGVSPPELELV